MLFGGQILSKDVVPGSNLNARMETARSWVWPLSHSFPLGLDLRGVLTTQVCNT